MPCHRELETFLLDYIEDAVRLGWSYMTVGLSEGPSRGLAATDAPQPLFTARTSGKRRTSSTKFASKEEVLSRLHARANERGMFRSATGKTTTVSGHRQRAVPKTHPTPKPLDTRLRIVASFVPS